MSSVCEIGFWTGDEEVDVAEMAGRGDEISGLRRIIGMIFFGFERGIDGRGWGRGMVRKESCGGRG